MRAIAIITGTVGSRIADRSDPSIPLPDEVKLRFIRVGICGTDRKELSGGRADAPDALKELISGHEMFGQVVGLGSSVARVKIGDFGVFTGRRGCGQRPSCLMSRSDMCQTGKYSERGLHRGAHIEGLITNRYPFTQFPESISHHPPDALKEVIEWSAAMPHS